MKLILERISEIRSAQRPNGSAVAIECDMTEGQMYDAVLSFLGHISDETWTNWCQEIAGQDHPFSCLHKNQGSFDSAAIGYEAEYWGEQAQKKADRDAERGALQPVGYYARTVVGALLTREAELRQARSNAK